MTKRTRATERSDRAGAEAVRSAIVSIGDELLSGRTTDTNAAYLGRKLGEWGAPVVRRFTVGDVAADIRLAVDAALDGAELVVTTGGLGPTRDDLTKGVVAQHLDRPLVVDETVRGWLEERFRAAGHDEVPAASRGQAEVPQGAVPLHNPEGTAPGLLVTRGGSALVLLPGVPTELRAIVEGPLGPALRDIFGARLAAGRLHHRVVHTTGIAESILAARLEERIAGLTDEMTEGVDIAFLPDARGVDLRFTARGGTDSEAGRRFERLLSELEEVLAPYRFEAETGDLVEAVAGALRRQGRTLAVVESCTGGLVSKRMTDLAGSSEVFVGGLVAYADETKTELLGVPEEDLRRDGAVSESVARALALAATRRFRSDTGIGITGVAGPGGGSEAKPVGTVWIATAVDGRTEARRVQLPGGRESVRERAAQAALADLYRRLVSAPPTG